MSYQCDLGKILASVLSSGKKGDNGTYLMGLWKLHESDYIKRCASSKERAQVMILLVEECPEKYFTK